MQRAERKFSPLPLVEAVKLPRLDFNLNLSRDYVDVDKIGINLFGLRTMMQMGGIRRLTVNGVEGKISRITPGVVGRNLDSAIAGGRTTAENVPVYSSSRTGNDDENAPPYLAGRWVNVTVDVNLTDIRDRNSKKLRSTKIWSKELNSAIKRGVLKEGMGHLTTDIRSLSEVRRSLIPVGLNVLNDTTWISSPFRMGAAAVIISTGNNMAQRLEFSYHRDQYNSEGYRFSLLPAGPQMDLAGILYMRSLPIKLVKELPSKKAS